MPKEDTQFKSGYKGGPGRPKGSRNKLGENFIRALSAHWEENGEKALDACLEKSPAAYVKTVAALLPKELTVRDGGAFANAVDELTDDELEQAIMELRKIAGAKEDETLH